MSNTPLNPRPQSTQNKSADSPAPGKARFWDKIARQYAADPIVDLAGYEKSVARIQQLLRPTDKLLEIGCGTGTTALLLAPSVADYLGTDISPQMLAIAREKLELQSCPSLRFELADADAPLSHSARCNVIVAFSVLHLVEDLDATAAACAAALVPGGLFISKTPCLAEMNPFIPWLAVPLMRVIGKAPPVRSLDQEALCAAMQRSGLEIFAVERHACKGRDVRPFIVARKPA